MHKNRFSKKFKKTELQYGEAGIAFKQEGRFEIKYIFALRRLLRRLKIRKSKKKRRVWIRNRSIWFFLFPNFIISRKSKNSRMGKGKGDMIRWTIRVRGGLMLLEFKGFSFYKIKFFQKRIQKNIQLRLTLVTTQLHNVSIYKNITNSLFQETIFM